MAHYSKGDRVRIDIPDETGPDFTEYHGSHGTIVDVLEDDAGSVTGDERDSYLYQVELDTGERIDVRWRDLRPILND